MPPAVHDALVDFADFPHESGAVILRGIPVGGAAADTCDTDNAGQQRHAERVRATDRRPSTWPTGRIWTRARR